MIAARTWMRGAGAAPQQAWQESGQSEPCCCAAARRAAAAPHYSYTRPLQLTASCADRLGYKRLPLRAIYFFRNRTICDAVGSERQSQVAWLGHFRLGSPGTYANTGVVPMKP